LTINDLQNNAKSNSVPPNCQFEVDDAEDEWTFNEKFDYIHGRAMFTCFQDTLGVFKRAYNALAPGGYFEMQEGYFKPHSDDGTSHGSILEKWNAMLVGAAAKTGRDWWCAPKYKDWFIEAGFEEVVERIYYWPSNPWPKGKKNKMLGLWTMTNTLDAVNAISMAMMTRVLGMSPEEVELMCVDVRKDIKDKSIHAYYPM
jgi:Methyltransferase domain